MTAAMSTFNDKLGNEWRIELDGPGIERVNDAFEFVDESGKGVKVDVFSEDGSGMIRLCSEGKSIVRACWLLCEEQAKEKGVTPEQFGKAMYQGEVIEAAEKALKEALVNFIRPSRRNALTAVLSSQDRVTAATLKSLTTLASDGTTDESIAHAIEFRMTSTLQRIVERLKASPSSANDLPVTSDAAPVE